MIWPFCAESAVKPQPTNQYCKQCGLQIIATDVRLCIYMLVTLVSYVKMAEPIEMPLQEGGGLILAQRNRLLDGDKSVHHLANMIE